MFIRNDLCKKTNSERARMSHKMRQMSQKQDQLVFYSDNILNLVILKCFYCVWPEKLFCKHHQTAWSLMFTWQPWRKTVSGKLECCCSLLELLTISHIHHSQTSRNISTTATFLWLIWLTRQISGGNELKNYLSEDLQSIVASTLKWTQGSASNRFHSHAAPRLQLGV